MRDFGLPGSLWLAAQKTGVFDLLQQLWPQPRSGPSSAHYWLLAAIHRICQPGPKTEAADWYDRTVGEQLHSVTTGVAKVLQCLRRLSMDLRKPKARWTEAQIRNKIQRWLSAQFLTELIRYQLDFRTGIGIYNSILITPPGCT